MPKTRVPVGPWAGGLNVQDDSQLIRDNQLVDALNVCISRDGSIINRPGMQAFSAANIGTTLRAAGGGDLGERLDVLGILNDTTFLVGRASWDTVTSTWQTNKIFKGVLSSDITSQTITWSDTGYASTTGTSFMTTDEKTMETSVANWKVLNYSISDPGPSLSRDTGNFHSGTASLKIDRSTGIHMSYQSLLTFNDATHTVPSPCTVTVSFWAKGDIGSVIVPGIRVYDSAMFAYVDAAPNSFIISDTNWHYYQMTYAIVSGYIYATPMIGVQPAPLGTPGRTGISYIDDVNLATTLTPYIVKTISYGGDVYGVPNYEYTTMTKYVNQSTSLDFSASTGVNIPRGLLFKPGTTTANSPSNDLTFAWKDRLFICYQDTVYFSKATDFSNWTAPDGGFFQVGNDTDSDKNYITSAIVLGDTLYLFKSQGTYAFNFQVDPNTDGYLRTISNERGAHAAVSWSGRIFTCDSESVYEFAGGRYLDIGRNLDLVHSSPGYSTIAAGSVIQSLHVMNDYLVLGPLISTSTPNSSGRYYAMNLYNGAWVKWDVYGGKYHIKDAGDADTLTCQGFSSTLVGPQHGLYHLGTSELGTQLVFMNFSDPSYVTDGNSSVQRLPRYSFETKQLTFRSNVDFKKVYRVQFDRSIGINDNGYNAANRVGGFGVKYVTPTTKAASLTSVLRLQSLIDDEFGNAAVGGAFRALAFSLFYEYYYKNQQTYSINRATGVYNFKVNGMFVYVSENADFSNVQQLASS